MDVMTIFDVVMILLGIYLIVSALNMKKKNEIGTMIITEEEAAGCRDKTGFIAYIFRREILLGVALILYGVCGLTDRFLVSVGVGRYAIVAVLLAAFFWFYKGLQDARTKFLG